jgi:DNA (cytosine-5)-methyltransferase 1
MGYYRAGFDVVGVDVNPQPRYPFEFHQADALEFLSERGDEFDAVHASPPCQHYANVTKWRGSADDHPDMVSDTRDLLVASDLPWVMENVPEAPIRRDYLLCGSMFGLPVRRHRAFEVADCPVVQAPPCRHRKTDLPFMHKGERAYADAMGCTWMSARGGRQAIPPAYTEYIGHQLMAAIEERQAA